MFHAKHFHNPTKACPIFNLSGAATEFPVCCTRAIQNVGQACQVHFCVKQAVFFPRGWARTSSPLLPLPGYSQPPAALPASQWLLRSALGLRGRLLDALGEKPSGKLSPCGALAVFWLHQACEGGQLSPNPRLVVLCIGGGSRWHSGSDSSAPSLVLGTSTVSMVGKGRGHGEQSSQRLEHGLKL